MTIIEAIGRVREGLNVQSDDSVIRFRFIFSVLKSVRIELIRQESNKDNLWNGANCQTLLAWSLNKNSISEIPSYISDVKVYKGAEIPQLVDTNFGKIILGVFFNNGQALNRIEYVDWAAKRKRRFRLGNPSFFIRDRRPYVIDYAGGKCIDLNIEAIWAEPEKVAILNDPSLCDSYIGDLEFHMPGYLERRIIDLTISEVGQKYNINPDTSNNGVDDSQGKVTQPQQQQQTKQ